MTKRKLPSPLVYGLELAGLALLAVGAWFVLKPMDTSTTSAVAGSNLAATPALAAAGATATRADWARQLTEAPARTSIWQVTVPAWSKPLPTWPPITPVSPPPPRAVALPSPRAPIRTGSPNVGSAQELVVANKAALPSSLFESSFLHMDGKTLVGVLLVAPGKESVVAIDLATGQGRVLADAARLTGGPQVSDRYAVWSDNRKLQVYDLQQGQKRDVGLDAFEVQIAGSRIIYRVIENGEWHIKGYNLGGQQVFSVADDAGNKGIPMVSKNWAVFTLPPKPSTVSGAYYYSTTLTVLNLDTREQIQLGQIQSSSRQYVPDGLFAIDAPWIAWATGQLGEATMHLYNLETRTASTVSQPMCQAKSTVPSGYLSKFRISSGIVLFKCGDYPGLYLGYDIQQKAFFSIPIQQLKTEADDLAGWMIVGGRIVWVWNGYANGKKESHIYTAQVLPQVLPYP
jgi:hypothetical protein